MIEVKNVTKKYPNIKAVDNINFTIKDGEVVGFLGPNGAGKTTTMNMITGFIEPTEGQIIINGFDIVKKSKKAKKQIGYMPEGVPLYTELTAREFVNYMAELKDVKAKERKEAVEKAIEETGLKDVQNKLIKNLSRGYKQRVSMAGALVGNPEVIILDEPTVGLDPKQITEIRSLIKELGKKHTVILSSHILSEVSQICERVIIINHGKIVVIDTPENLENKTKEKNTILVTVEDKNEKMKNLKEEVKEIEEIKLVKDNEDGTKQYAVTSADKVDLRKKIFEILPKQDITIFELKKDESTLEDAFIKLIDSDKKENTNKEESKEKIKEKKIKEKEEKKAKKQSKGGKE
ncbi:aBC-type multidrug transport system ATPase component [Clostridium sp. CAG:567]|nr:aBC-type multidrug transport system ATPase component [Clostridium sp. CAG:567]